MCISIFVFFGRMHSVIDQLRCSDTDSEDSDNLDTGDDNDDYFDLRTFAPIVSAHPYCARESHATSCHVLHRARALSTKINK